MDDHYFPLGKAGALVGAGPSEIIEVPSRHVGFIIGKGGQTIQELERMSGAKIQVSQEVRPGVCVRGRMRLSVFFLFFLLWPTTLHTSLAMI